MNITVYLNILHTAAKSAKVKHNYTLRLMEDKFNAIINAENVKKIQEDRKNRTEQELKDKREKEAAEAKKRLEDEQKRIDDERKAREAELNQQQEESMEVEMVRNVCAYWLWLILNTPSNM